jgi:putative heme-binding domain-containing protein
VPLAVEALKDWQVNAKALECITALGGPAEAGAITDFAKQNPSTDVVVTTIRTLGDWRKRAETSDAAARELDESVAEIQGATGIVIRWEASGSLPAKSATSIVDRLRDSERRTQFATGAEGRLVLAPRNAAQDGAWVAQSVVRVNEPADVEFLSSSSGSLRVWLNGKSVHERAETQSFRIDSDQFGGKLTEGDNRLVVMVDRSAAPVEFHLRLRRKSATAQHERLIQAALARAGNVERGRQSFLNVEKSQCLKCHRVGEQGERTGPELTGIGTRFSRIYIVESILEPSRTIAPSFGTVIVLFKDGRTLSGVKTAETQAEFTLVDNQGQKHVVQKSEIEEQKPSAQSTMPDGLEKKLTEQEFVDLIAYFASLKESRAP